MFGRKRQHPSWSEAETLMKEMVQKEPVQISAEQRLHQIAQGLQLDGVEPDADLMKRLARVATEGYVEEHRRYQHAGLSQEMIQQVFETSYREAFERRTFLNPSTGEFEEW